ncbi:hypothetical protein MSPP1_002475 [Malassezia sp. CBS 17886]|nr:hypothetical protein MSPP1_002475 [Malassezia sp. CBS 17886]
MAPHFFVRSMSETSAPPDDQPRDCSMWASFIAGGAAGAASRTIVSPLERLKIIMQVQPTPGRGEKKAYPGVWQGLVKIWREEGFSGFMRGNGINCLRIAPYSAVQFSSYEWLKRLFAHRTVTDVALPGARTAPAVTYELNTFRRLAAGALAGIACVVSTYPLDLVRSRISIASASMSHSNGGAHEKVPGIIEMTMKVYREEGGLYGLYRGCIPTSMGVAPYVAFNFFFYESSRSFFTHEDGTPPNALIKLACGAWAGAVSQTLTYPLDVIRRRMQVAGMPDSHLGYRDKSGIDAICNIVRRSGIRGLYFGLYPNLLKVAPSMGTSFLTYEAVRGLLRPWLG